MAGNFIGPIVWEQIAFSIFIAAMVTKDMYSNEGSKIRLLSNIMALIGCLLLASNGIIRPTSLILMASATCLFIISFSLHVYNLAATEV